MGVEPGLHLGHVLGVPESRAAVGKDDAHEARGSVAVVAVDPLTIAVNDLDGQHYGLSGIGKERDIHRSYAPL